VLSRLATKLHDRMGVRAGGPLDRVLARARRPLGRTVLAREGHLAALDELGRLAEVSVVLDRFGRGPAGRVALEELGRDIPPRPSTPPPGDGRRVLVLSLRAWTAHNVYESLLAHGLRARGAEVALLTCGGGQPLCEVGWAREAWPRPCDRCGWYTDRVARAARMPHYRLSDGLPWGPDARRAPHTPPAGGPDPYRASEISVPWMLKSTDVERSPRGEETVRDFAVAAAGVAAAAERAMDDFRPDTVVLLSGLFAAERVVREAARARGIGVVSYEMAPRESSLVFSAGTPAPLYDTDRAWAQARDRPLTAPQRQAIETMLEARSEGRAAHERYYDDPLTDAERVRSELDVPAGARVVSLFTNLAWDSAVVGRDDGYDSMLDWIRHAVEVTGGLRDTVLVVRVHPAEARWGTMQPVAQALGDLPPNVRVVGPEQPLSSYALLALSDLVLAYTTTVGLEAAVRGIPVAVAALTHYRERGFTYDVRSPEDLRALLEGGGWELSPEQVELALRYAFVFFFKCMIPFPSVPLDQGRPLRVPDDPEDLRPGSDPYLDFVCDRILDGGDFVLPDDLALPAEASS
jgi:hypothetical protein